MTAATVTTRFRGPELAHEYVILTVTDGETYTTDMSSPQIAFATTQANDDGEVNCTISSRTVTINAAGMTDKKIGLHIVGYK